MKEILKSDKLLKIAVIAGIAVVVLIFVSNFDSTFAAKDTVSAEETLEQRLSEVISNMDGIGKDGVRRVMVRLGEDGRTVTGVAVVCDKADDVIIRERLLDAVSKALDVSVSRVCITN